MSKRWIDIDDKLLSEARSILDGATTEATVNSALKSMVNTELRRRHLRRLQTGSGTDLADGDIMSGAWDRSDG